MKESLRSENGQFPTSFTHNNDLIMTIKVTELTKEQQKWLEEGHRVSGSMFIVDGKGYFKPYKRQSLGHHAVAKVLKVFAFGKVVETPSCIKVHESMPKELGVQKMIDYVDMNHEDIIDTLESWEAEQDNEKDAI